MASHRLNHKARKIYIERHGIPSCSHCGKVPADVHHLNENLEDNSDENLVALCRSCHTAYHNHREPRRKKFFGVEKIRLCRWIVIFGGEIIYRDDCGHFFKMKKDATNYGKALCGI